MAWLVYLSRTKCRFFGYQIEFARFDQELFKKILIHLFLFSCLPSLLVILPSHISALDCVRFERMERLKLCTSLRTLDLSRADILSPFLSSRLNVFSCNRNSHHKLGTGRISSSCWTHCTWLVGLRFCARWFQPIGADCHRLESIKNAHDCKQLTTLRVSSAFQQTAHQLHAQSFFVGVTVKELDVSGKWCVTVFSSSFLECTRRYTGCTRLIEMSDLNKCPELEILRANSSAIPTYLRIKSWLLAL